MTGNDLDSKSTSVLFEFNEKNDIVSVGDRDQYFACAYAVNGTNQMETYPALREILKKQMGKISQIGSGERKTLSAGSFQTVDGPEIENPTISV